MTQAVQTTIALARKLIEQKDFNTGEADKTVANAIHSVLALIEERGGAQPKVAALVAQVRAALPR